MAETSTTYSSRNGVHDTRLHWLTNSKRYRATFGVVELRGVGKTDKRLWVQYAVLVAYKSYTVTSRYNFVDQKIVNISSKQLAVRNDSLTLRFWPIFELSLAFDFGVVYFESSRLDDFWTARMKLWTIIKKHIR